MRLLQGIGSGVCVGLGRIVIVDIVQGDQLAKVGSYFALPLTLSPLLAPTLGAYIQQAINWQANFIVLGSLLLIALLIYLFFAEETNHYKNPKAFSVKILYHNYKDFICHPIFVAYTLIAGLAMSIIMFYATLSPFIFQEQFQ